MEIKTCEAYVLSVLENTENELEAAKDEISRLKRALEILEPRIEGTHDGNHRIETAFLWTSYEDSTKLFYELKELLHLEMPNEDEE